MVISRNIIPTFAVKEMMSEENIIDDLYQLGMDPSNFQINFDKGVSEIRRIREIETLMKWRGENNIYVKEAKGKITELSTEVIIWMNNDNILHFSTEGDMTDMLLSVYKTKEYYHKRFDDPNIGNSYYLVVAKEANKTLRENATILLGVLDAYSNRCSFSKEL